MLMQENNKEDILDEERQEEIIRKAMKPTNDIVFQNLFSRGNENITKAMLEKILKMKIEKIDLDKSKDLSNNYFDEKNGRLDIRATLNGNIDCDIEMQVIAHKKIFERMLYYWSKMYVGNLSIGESYLKLKKAISIIIMDQEIEKLKGLPAHTTWRIRESKIGKMVLTDDLEIHIIELKKVIAEYEKDKDNELLQWMFFLEDPNNLEVV